MEKSWFKVALINLLVAASTGALLRFAFVREISWMDFRHFLHAHSHLATLGWAHLALFVFLVNIFLAGKDKKRKYQPVFWLTQLSVAGMYICFLLWGYGTASIAFLILNVLLSYLFIYHFLHDLRFEGSPNAFSVRFARTALYFLLLSTLALWAIAPIMILNMQGQAIYYTVIQFYLHFQFNGWFVFGVFALFLRFLENLGVPLSKGMARPFYYLLVTSCYLTFALAVTWSNPEPWLFWINSSGVLIQLAAWYYLVVLVRSVRSRLPAGLSSPATILLKAAYWSFNLKILIQAAVALPLVATIAYTIRNFSIGFLHLLLIGVITFFLLAAGIQNGSVPGHLKIVRIGTALMIAGFASSELLLFLQGTMFWAAFGFLPYYYEMLFTTAMLMPVGLGLLIFPSLRAWRHRLLDKRERTIAAR